MAYITSLVRGWPCIRHRGTAVMEVPGKEQELTLLKVRVGRRERRDKGKK
jgi:hypothetical protein